VKQTGKSMPYDRSHFPHEREALKEIWNNLVTSKQAVEEVVLYPIYHIHNRKDNSMLECDLLVISPWFNAVVDLKHWGGMIDIPSPTNTSRSQSTWILGKKPIPNPHNSNKFKAQILKDNLDDAMRRIDHRFIHSIIILTDPNGLPTFKHNPKQYFNHKDKKMIKQLTFGSIDDFCLFIRNRVNDSQKYNSNSLNIEQFKVVKTYIDKDYDAQAILDYKHQIPGFSIQHERSTTPIYREYLAFPLSQVDTTLCRLRVCWQLDSDPHVKNLQVRNFKAISQLDPHPNILSCREHQNEKDILIEVSPWNDYQTLRELIDAQRSEENTEVITLDKAKSIAQGILSGLMHIHDKGLIHRDICPENVLIQGNDIKIMNFDLAYDPKAEYTVMDDDCLKLITPYRAPELFEKAYDVHADMFSFGVLMYEVLTGKEPFKSWHELQKTDNMISSELLAQVPERFVTFIPLIKSTVKFFSKERLIARQLLDLLKVQPVAKFAKDVDLSPGQCLNENDWKILSEMGRGANAQVYLAEDIDGVRFALKVFSHQASPTAIRWESQIARNSEHENLMKTFTQFTIQGDGRRALMLEYCEGSTLQKLISNGERPDLPIFCELAEQALHALASLHTQTGDKNKVIHNDINPRNLIWNPEKKLLKIIDFGAATHEGVHNFRGTPRYIDNGLVEDGMLICCPAGDLFSLAVTLYEWLTGEHPFGDEAHFATVPKALSKELTEDIDLSGWFYTALQGDIDCRYASAKDMLDAMNKIYEASTCPDTDRSTEPFLELEDDDLLYDELVGRKSASLPELTEMEASSTADSRSPDAQVFTTECDSSDLWVNYINSLHSVTGQNQNALAESQALNPFFGQIVVHLEDLQQQLIEILRSPSPALIILTGHAGDGKSTLALDIYKTLKKFPLAASLDSPLQAEEVIEIPEHSVHLIKDLSEVPLRERADKIDALITAQAHALVIANTGPLLNTLQTLAENHGVQNLSGLENHILSILQDPQPFSRQTHCLNEFRELPVYILNLNQIDNLPYAMKLAHNLTEHSEWEKCKNCLARSFCPIYKNVEWLKTEDTMRRVERIYRRLTDYGQRYTLRQLSGHIAFTITAGLDCKHVRQADNHFRTHGYVDYLVSASVLPKAAAHQGFLKKKCLLCSDELK